MPSLDAVLWLPLSSSLELDVIGTDDDEMTWQLGPAGTPEQMAEVVRKVAAAAEVLARCLVSELGSLYLAWFSPDDEAEEDAPQPGHSHPAAGLLGALAPLRGHVKWFGLLSWHVDGGHIAALAEALPECFTLCLCSCTLSSQAWVEMHAASHVEQVRFEGGPSAFDIHDLIVFCSSVRRRVGIFFAEEAYEEELAEALEACIPKVDQQRAAVGAVPLQININW
jgi:hypothetical protein